MKDDPTIDEVFDSISERMAELNKRNLASPNSPHLQPQSMPEDAEGKLRFMKRAKQRAKYRRTQGWTAVRIAELFNQEFPRPGGWSASQIIGLTRRRKKS